MFKNWGTWLGIENENGQVKEEDQSIVSEDRYHDINKPTESEQSSAVEDDAQPPQLLQKAKGFSGKSHES